MTIVQNPPVAVIFDEDAMGSVDKAQGDKKVELVSVDVTVFVNGHRHVLQNALLADALVELGFGPGPVATALNGEFVPNRKRSAVRLVDGDRLEVLTARQGG
jgi:sulfur carrier protein